MRKAEVGKVVRRTSIGGQAVLEGVMMKSATSVATAVRTETGEITVESKRLKDPKKKSVFSVCLLYAGLSISVRNFIWASAF